MLTPRHLPMTSALLALSVLLFSPQGRADDHSFITVDKAAWHAQEHKLLIKAHGAVVPRTREQTRVKVKPAGTTELLLSRRVNLEDDGRWAMVARKLLAEGTKVPCQVVVTAGGVSQKVNVSNRPADCGGTNQNPVADAGPDQQLTLASGQTQLRVTLDGSASHDPDGSIASYIWKGSPDPRNVVSPSLDLGAGVYTFTLQVRDNLGARSNIDSVQISIADATQPGGISINSTSTNRNDLAPPVSEQPFTGDGNHAVLAANDLGMHCADLDYRVFSILPPFNVMHAQVIKKGANGVPPQLLDDSDVEVVYSATANPNDPALSRDPVAPVYKSNFWADPDGDGRTIGYDTYAPLYFGLLEPTDISTRNTGLPVPDSILLRGCLADYLSGAEGPAGPRSKCGLGQQRMPGADAPYASNEPIPFERYDRRFNFFNELLGGLGLGGIIDNTNWFAADGVPMLPVDDSGRRNSYPMMRVQARSKSTGQVLASSDIVLPIASEADCQLCHAPKLDCAATDPSLDCNEYGINRTSFRVMTLDGDGHGQTAPGATPLERLINVAKINILRVHDAKHGTRLDASRPVQCSTCHYSPALDLAQLGPTDSPNTDQTHHISMSRAMHAFHGALKDDSGAPLFPAMPGPVGRNRDSAMQVLDQTCYACHPGKQTRCLRGAMAAGGVVCQDCHGNMQQVGNDFSENLAHQPWPGGANLNKRVPWASEPGCQSCHTGDALDNLAGKVSVPVAADGIRLLKAYSIQAGLDPAGNPDGSKVAVPTKAVNQRFAENQSLYRLSKGHGGLMCEGCHGSTHAIYPHPLANANDNIAATQLQGHAGSIIECDTCHAPGSLGLTLNGPHGMHPVNDSRWNRSHEDLAERNPAACQSCHGANGEGTVLSRTAADRELICKDGRGSLCSAEGQHILVPAHTPIGCAQCHANMANGGD